MTFNPIRTPDEPKRHTWHQAIDARGAYVGEPTLVSTGTLHKGDLFFLIDDKGQESGWQVATTEPWADDNGIWTIAAMAVPTGAKS